MNDAPVSINRRLTDDERALLSTLAVWSVAEQYGVDMEEAARALDDLGVREGGIFFSGNDIKAAVTAGPQRAVIVEATREWLAFYAHSTEPLTREDLLRSLVDPEDCQ